MRTSKLPTRKMTGVGVGGAAAVVLVWVLGLFNVEMPVEVASASTVLLAFVVGYFVKDR